MRARRRGENDDESSEGEEGNEAPTMDVEAGLEPPSANASAESEAGLPQDGEEGRVDGNI